jgi:starch phosphorylase
VDAFKETLLDNLYYVRGQAIHSATIIDIYKALAYTVRDYLMTAWQKNVNAYWDQNPKFVYYFSAEYLMGQQLSQNMFATDTEELARIALADFGFSLDDIMRQDIEPGLGNGGLGRLAACYMDSLATLDIPAVGYGIRYEYGIFKQTFKDGWQVESPDDWLYYGNPWEFPQEDDMVEVGFGGYTQSYIDVQGQFRVRWIPDQKILGEPYHTLVPGYKTHTVNMLRLWQARATRDFDFQLFDVGDYARAVEQKTMSENISKVLYPNDRTMQGKELRLRQQYFFVACSLQDIIRRFQIKNKDQWDKFPDIVVIQLNDTHPVIAIPELMRILIDSYQLDWDHAWAITSKTFASTQHTLLPESLEKWPVWLMERVLPRHLEIIYEINRRFLEQVRSIMPDQTVAMSIIEEGPERHVRMAHLACVASFSVNGVAELQTKLLREQLLSSFNQLWPEKFNNKTNGVSPRRFMHLANPSLSVLITRQIGDDWLKNLDDLKRLEPLADDAEFRASWRQIKQQNKVRFSAYIDSQLGIRVNPDSLFDVMAKRMHEYKRQMLKTLHIITLYNQIKANPEAEILPRTFIFGAKAAPGYTMAKLIIKLINNVANVINNDPEVTNRLRIAFLPNFNVTLGEKLYPAADLSEQISLAGKEASGTGNMKFALNGALTIGTLDGANIEIRDCVGAENFFLFGLTSDEAIVLRQNRYSPKNYYDNDSDLRGAIDRLASGWFSPYEPTLFQPIIDSLLYNDEYLLFADYRAYLECQEQVSAAYRDVDNWTRMSILNVARCGFFSSDRAIKQYCEQIWKVTPLIFK